MARTTISIEGLNRLRLQLNRVPAHIREGARDAIEESAEAVRDQVRREIRVNTGNLRRSVRIRKIGAHGLSADVGWFSRDDYYVKFQEFGTSSITADPVLTRASAAETARFPRRVRRHVGSELDRL